jgi:hypothetical protein
MREVIQFEVNGFPGNITVGYNDKFSWIWNTITPEILQVANPELRAKIDGIATEKVAAYLKEEKRKEDARREQERIKRENGIAKLKAEVEPLLKAGFTLKVTSPSSFIIEKSYLTRQYGVEVDYQEKIPDHTSFGFSHTRTTSLPWRLRDPQLHIKRYSSLKAAVSHTEDIVDKEIKSAISKVNDETAKITKQKLLKEELGKNGMSLFIETKSYTSGRHYETYKVEKAGVEIQPRTDSEYKRISVMANVSRSPDKSLFVYDTAIIGKMTIEQYKKLIDFVRELGIEKA